MGRQNLVERINTCKADMQATKLKLVEAELSGNTNRINRLHSAQRYQQIELNRMAHELAEMDSCTVLP